MWTLLTETERTQALETASGDCSKSLKTHKIKDFVLNKVDTLVGSYKLLLVIVKR